MHFRLHAIDEKELHGLLAVAITDHMANTCNNHSITGLNMIQELWKQERLFWTTDPKFSHLLISAISKSNALSSDSSAIAMDALGPQVPR